MTEGEWAQLSSRLAEAHRRVRALPEPAERERLQRRLIAITNVAKHDPGTALRRITVLLGVLGEQDRTAGDAARGVEAGRAESGSAPDTGATLDSRNGGEILEG